MSAALGAVPMESERLQIYALAHILVGEPVSTSPGCSQHGRTDMKPLIEVLLFLLDAYWWIVIIAVIVSWLIAFNVINTRHHVVAMITDVLWRLTEPVFRPIRNLMPNLGGLDLSPLIVLLIIYVLERSIVLYVYPNVF
ncbi:MAG TPA: YggT family protein [Xanthobacteraceae bacterium]|jgi:YggT family protein